MTKIWTLILLSNIACGQTTVKQYSSNTKTNGDWKTLDQTNYFIQYPSTWELNQRGDMGTSFVLLSPFESAQDNFRENVNLLIQDLTGHNIDLNEYTKISEGQIEKSTLIESKRIKNGSDKYHKMIYTLDQGILHLKVEQYYWVIKDKAYIVTFTSEQEKFADFKETGEEILNTFRLKE